MNRTQILSAVLGLLIVGAGYLFYKGYWDTWEDRQDELAQILKDEALAVGVSTELVGPTTECFARAIVSELHNMGCPVPLKGESIMLQADFCFSRDSVAQISVSVSIAACLQESIQNLQNGNQDLEDSQGI